jgi:SAM-dependent methyltransferase
MTSYSHNFYETNRTGSLISARQIVPLVMDLVKPKSVVDVGCGLGTWLSVFDTLGVQDYIGIDGEWVDQSQLEIPQSKFVRAELQAGVRLNRKFDLVLSLEVAEHLPPDCAALFVDSLTALGPVVLFSAAIPYQGGTNHRNEQWPEYWRDLFQTNHFVVIDALRNKLWQNGSVEYWYAQNILLFVRRDYMESSPPLRREAELTRLDQLNLVHPRKYSQVLELYNRIHAMALDLAEFWKAGETLIIVDQDNFRPLFAAGCRILPFLEMNGAYWGPPSDSDTAIRELKRLRESGAAYIAFAWPAFWWLDYYTEFRDYLRSTFPCVLENSQLITFDLTTTL